MTIAYFNYPIPEIKNFLNLDSAQIGKQNKTNQRYIKIGSTNLAAELNRFASKHYAFGSDSSKNDMYIEINLGDRELELGILELIQGQLGRYYSRFSSSRVQIVTK